MAGLNKQTSAEDVVILIHGTFAKKTAIWVRDDSTLAKAITSQLPIHRIKAFRWSGRNTHGARISAGEELAGLIDRWATDLPSGAGVHLIGHSHGGNVALYAQAICRHKEKIKSIACLGTPFLHIDAHRIDDFIRFWVLVAALMISLVSVPILVIAVLEWHISDPLLYLLNVTTEDGKFLTRFITLILIWSALVDRLFHDGINWRRKSETWLHRELSGKVQTFANRFQCKAPTQRVFIAITRGDEARILLETGRHLSEIPKRAFALIRLSLWPALITAVILHMALYPVSNYIHLTPVYPDSIDLSRDPLGTFDLMLFFLFLAGLMPFAILVANFVFRSNPLVFGWENLVSSLACGVRPVAMPDWIEGKEVALHRTSAQTSGLRHSAFYDDSSTIDALVRWLAGDKLKAYDKQPEVVQESLPFVLRRWLPWIAVAITATYCVFNAAQNLRVVGMW